LIARAKTRTFTDPIDEMKQLYTYLNLIDGQEEIFNILDLIKNVDFKPHPRLEELKVLHSAQIAQSVMATATKLRHAHGMQMFNTQFAKKEDRLQEAAKLYLRAGNFREYCETLVELGDYKKAMAFAPAVGIEYWQELSERHVKFLEQ
jgi:hypothetical protein